MNWSHQKCPPRPPVTPAACTSTEHVHFQHWVIYIQLPAASLRQTLIPWYHSEPCTHGSRPQSALSQNRAAYLKRNHACFIWLSRMCHVQGNVFLSPFCIAYYSQGKKSDTWGTAAFTYLQVHADTGPVKGILRCCGTYAVSEVMFFGASKQRTWSQLHYLSKNLTWPSLDILLVPEVWGVVLFFSLIRPALL